MFVACGCVGIIVIILVVYIYFASIDSTEYTLIFGGVAIGVGIICLIDILRDIYNITDNVDKCLNFKNNVAKAIVDNSRQFSNL